MKTENEQLPTKGKEMINFNQPPSLSNDLTLHSQAMENVDDSIVINKDANDSNIDLKKISNISESDVTGCNTNHSTIQQGNGNEHIEQKNIVTTNNGITGISGGGHNIYNYACPPEIVELILKLAKKEGLL
jgi:hypothetical protein